LGRKEELNPEKLVEIIKKPDSNASKIISYFDKDGDISVLERLNLMIGYEDDDYTKTFKASVKYIPTDEIMRLLITESTTCDWNPVVFAIFYQRVAIVEWFC
jgi:hypothetical protein